MVRNEHGFVDMQFGTPRSAIIWNEFPGASAFNITKKIQRDQKGQILGSSYERIILMSMLSDIERRNKGNTEICLHIARLLAAFATQFKPGRWRLLGAATENTW